MFICFFVLSPAYDRFINTIVTISCVPCVVFLNALPTVCCLCVSLPTDLSQTAFGTHAATGDEGKNKKIHHDQQVDIRWQRTTGNGALLTAPTARLTKALVLVEVASGCRSVPLRNCNSESGLLWKQQQIEERRRLRRCSLWAFTVVVVPLTETQQRAGRTTEGATVNYQQKQ